MFQYLSQIHPFSQSAINESFTVTRFVLMNESILFNIMPGSQHWFVSLGPASAQAWQFINLSLICLSSCLLDIQLGLPFFACSVCQPAQEIHWGISLAALSLFITIRSSCLCHCFLIVSKSHVADFEAARLSANSTFHRFLSLRFRLAHCHINPGAMKVLVTWGA